MKLFLLTQKANNKEGACLSAVVAAKDQKQAEDMVIVPYAEDDRERYALWWCKDNVDVCCIGDASPYITDPFIICASTIDSNLFSAHILIF